MPILLPQMSLNLFFNRLLTDYQNAKAIENNFTGNVLGKLVREEIPDAIKGIINNDRYKVSGSIGAGNWAGVPWVGLFDRLITNSAQCGYYLVYLVNEDCSGFYLSLNQGVTTVKERYGSDSKRALVTRANDFLALLGTIDKSYQTGAINLSVSRTNNLGSLYEKGAICSKYYAKENIPHDFILETDLRHMLDLYLLLATKEYLGLRDTAVEADEDKLYEEDLRLLKEHKRIERNRELAMKAKKIHGYKCKACEFDFFKTYGTIGEKFIEAHHLTPLSELKGQKFKLDPRRDFSVLCSNCHRMIHRSTTINDVEAFRNKYLKQK